MNEPNVYLEKLSAFSRMLRLEGLTVGPGETADAARILTQVGFTDRELVKAALRTVFAKSREEQLAFDRVFSGGSFARQHHRTGAVINRIRHVRNFRTGGTNIMNH